MNAEQASRVAAAIVEQVRAALPAGCHAVLVIVADDEAAPGRLVEGFAATLPTELVADVLERDVVPALRSAAAAALAPSGTETTP